MWQLTSSSHNSRTQDRRSIHLKEMTMQEVKQQFQRPWQLAALELHAAIEQIENFITAPFRRLINGPNTKPFQDELDRKRRHLSIIT